MKYISILILLIVSASCQITETININSDGSGSIEIVQLRDENSYMQMSGEKYSREEAFKDTTYVFQEFITKYNETFLKYTPLEQQLFKSYSTVKVNIKKSSFEKEFRNTFTQDFNKVSDIADLYKTERYASDLKNNYALTAENDYFKVEYSFEGKIFKRLVSITNQNQLQKEKEEFKKLGAKYSALKLTQSYVLRYHFPGKIKSVSNEKAILSPDKKTVTAEFLLSDCMQNPEMTNLEIVLE
ncbi:hypothetical protein [Flavobacterium sp. FlaQc-47]|uniref:hypothetical protein n=1 Tax=Flavobacterium sp. FlaQc-47 TaxID=3374180 RepID=UPI003756B2B0